MSIAAGFAGLIPAHDARADCLDEAAAYWGVPVALARAIAMHESHMRADAVNKNRDGSLDIGLMQINTSWLPTLAKNNIPEADLFDACKNAYIGNWILAQNMARLGRTWNAVGAFNAASIGKRETYVRQIFDQMKRFEGSEQSEIHATSNRRPQRIKAAPP